MEQASARWYGFRISKNDNRYTALFQFRSTNFNSLCVGINVFGPEIPARDREINPIRQQLINQLGFASVGSGGSWIWVKQVQPGQGFLDLPLNWHRDPQPWLLMRDGALVITTESKD